VSGFFGEFPRYKLLGQGAPIYDQKQQLWEFLANGFKRDPMKTKMVDMYLSPATFSFQST